MHCHYEKYTDNLWRCPFCGDIAQRETKRPCHRPPMGDKLARWLLRKGVTKASWIKFLGNHVVAGGMNCYITKYSKDELKQCGCDTRLELLNLCSRISRRILNFFDKNARNLLTYLHQYYIM